MRNFCQQRPRKAALCRFGEDGSQNKLGIAPESACVFNRSVDYLDKRGLYLITERVVCLNKGREGCMCMFKERQRRWEVGERIQQFFHS